jgi:hypothetical protein
MHHPFGEPTPLISFIPAPEGGIRCGTKERLVIPTLLRAALLALALLIAPGSALAFQGRGAAPAATPVPAGGGHLDLASMAIDSTDMPPEFLLVFETYLTPDDLAFRLMGSSLTPEEIAASGLVVHYESSYSTPAGSARVRSYLQEYTDDVAAADGFLLFEDEQRILPGAPFTDEPGPGIGEEPSEITVGSYFVSESGSTEPTTIDLTFRQGRLLAGISMDTIEGVSVDRDLVLFLAERLNERILAVLAGESLPLIDQSLPSQFVGLGESWVTTNEGYWSVPEVYGPETSPSVVQDFQSGYFRADAYDPQRLGGFPLPRVAINVAAFGSEDAPLELLGNLEALHPPGATLEQVELDPVPDSSVTLGFQFANTFYSGATTDSFRVYVLLDSTLLTVDVQGNGSADAARDAAIAVVEAQISCLQQSTSCGFEEIPDSLFGDPSTPVPGVGVG